MRTVSCSPPQYSKFLLLIILTILTQLCLKPASAHCHVDDESGLLGFKSAITADPSGLLSTWKPRTNCCKWSGVFCGVNNRVTNLSLSGQPGTPNISLSGTISFSLTKVKCLHGLYLKWLRGLSGPFPNILFGLPKLKYVYIENNNLSGPIPESIGNLNQLSALSLLGNHFIGPIPSSISNLTRLTQLNLGGNLLTTIPTEIQNLKNLTLLSLERNQFIGSIPNFIGTLSNLQILRLFENNFTGEIPTSISTLAPTLAFLDLRHNLLTGKIPDFLGNFKNLNTLILAQNNLIGTVPKSFANLTKIINLDLSHNNLVDPFPKMKVQGIKSLDLSYNNFHLNKIPEWVTSSPNISSLKLAKCGIKMRFEDFKPSKTHFYNMIDLSENWISGSPVELLDKTEYLVSFKASGNKLKFDLESLRIVQTMKELNLSRNLVFGKVPKTVSGLDKLDVSDNHLCGPLPATKFPKSSFMKNRCLCGPPLSPCKLCKPKLA